MGEQIPLTMREHSAMRQLAAALTGITVIEPILEKRAKTVKNGWFHFRGLKKQVETVFDDLIKTVPSDKLTRFKMELNNTRYAVYTDYVKTATGESGYVCIKEETLIKIVSILQEQCCEFCEKTGREIKKCPVRKAIAETINFETPGMTTDNCVWAISNINSITGKVVEGANDE